MEGQGKRSEKLEKKNADGSMGWVKTDKDARANAQEHCEE